jgi:hypothetical protein
MDWHLVALLLPAPVHRRLDRSRLFPGRMLRLQ